MMNQQQFIFTKNEALIAGMMRDIITQPNLTIPAEIVRNEIVKSFATVKSENGVIGKSPLRLSLIDKLSKQRIRIPARSVYCSFAQFHCFDLFSFLEFSTKSRDFAAEGELRAWRCPHCLVDARHELLRIDGFVEEILLKLGPSTVEAVELFPDGNWRPANREHNDINGEGVPKKKSRISDQIGRDSSGILPAPSSSNSTDESNQLATQLSEVLGLTNGGNVAVERSSSLSPNAQIVDAVLKLKQTAEEDANTIDVLHELLDLDKNTTITSTDKHVRLVAAVLALKHRAETVFTQNSINSNINNNRLLQTEHSLSISQPQQMQNECPQKPSVRAVEKPLLPLASVGRGQPTTMSRPFLVPCVTPQNNETGRQSLGVSSLSPEGTECENQPSTSKTSAASTVARHVSHHQLPQNQRPHYVRIEWRGQVTRDCPTLWLHEIKGRGRALTELLHKELGVKCNAANGGVHFGNKNKQSIVVRLASPEDAARVQSYFNGRSYPGVLLRAAFWTPPAPSPSPYERLQELARQNVMNMNR